MSYFKRLILKNKIKEQLWILKSLKQIYHKIYNEEERKNVLGKINLEQQKSLISSINENLTQLKYLLR